MDNQDKSIIKYILIISLIVFLTLIFYLIYNELQDGILNQADSFLFVRNGHPGIIFIIMGAVTIIYFLLKMPFSKNFLLLMGVSKKIKLLPLLILTIIFLSASLVYQFFSFSLVTQQGIIHRSNIFDKQELLKWEEVQNVSISTSYESKGISRRARRYKVPMLHYNIIAKDGEVLKLENADDFWNRILTLDGYLVKKGLPTKREEISHYTFIQLIITYGIDENSEIHEVLQKLLTVKE